MDVTELRTERLLLRPWRPADAPAVLAACQDPSIQQWTRVPTPYTEADARAFVEQVAPAEWAAGTGAPYAVLDLATGELRAAVGLQGISGRDRLAEVGVWCVAASRNQGVVTEAVGALCRWAFDGLHLQRLEWLAQVGNDASRRVADKAGFRPEGVARNRLNHRGVQHDAWVGALVPDDLR